MTSSNPCLPLRRGILKAFRIFLNDKYGKPDSLSAINGTGIWRAGARGQYGNRVRAYGDWLYYQDRGMFDELLARTLESPNRGETDFDGSLWVVAKNKQ